MEKFIICETCHGTGVFSDIPGFRCRCFKCDGSGKLETQSL